MVNILKSAHSYELFYLSIISYIYPMYYIKYKYPNIIILLIIFYILDLSSGIVHIYLDNYKGNNTYILPHAQGFQNHHKDPKEFTKRGLIRVFSEPAFFVIILNLINCYFLNFYLLIFTILVNLVQLSHYQAHCITHKSFQKNTTYIFKFLQYLNILLPAVNHSKHHDTYDNNFCIFNGWANPLLNFFYKLYHN